MKCNNCGAELEQNTMFCGSCGTPVPQPQAQPEPQPVPQYQAPVYQAPVQPQRPVSKNQFIATMASEKAKKGRKLAPIIALVCALVLVVGYFAAMNTALYDLPIITVVIPADEREDLEDEMEEVADQGDYIKDWLKMHEDDLSSKELKAAEKVLDSAVDAGKNFSISNMDRLVKAAEKADDLGIADELDLDGVDEIGEAFGIFKGLLIGGLIFVLLFTVLGGLCKSKGLVVVGMIFSVFYTLPMAGIIFTILSVVGHIVLLSQMGIADKEYKAYRQSLRA